MNKYVQHLWNDRRAECPLHPLPVFRADGIVWGAGTMLAYVRGTPGGERRLDIERDHNRAIALVAAVTRRVRPDLIRYFEQASAHWQAGNEAGANIQLAFARVPRLGGWDGAWQLFLAEELLLNGLGPAALLKELGFAGDEIALLKYPGQPRVPAGNGDQSGRFGAGGQGDNAQVTPVFYREPHEVPPKHDPGKPQDEEHADQNAVPPAVPGISNPGPGVGTRGAPEFEAPATGATKPAGSSPSAAQTGPTSKPKSSAAGSGTQDSWTPDIDPANPCPPAVPQVDNRAGWQSVAYENWGHNYVNGKDAIPPGFGVPYHGVMNDDCAKHDDPQGRWKAGDMIEFKGTGKFSYFFTKYWFDGQGIIGQGARQEAAVAGTGRKNAWLIDDGDAVDDFKLILDDYKSINVFHVPMK